jgi:2-polyprenyl-6-hydroxyphenyl methylase/3-demethylubiquinone-9 3-methyltransferase
MDQTFAGEIAAGERFEFGKNWKRYLASLDPARIAEAERSLLGMLELPSLEGLRFLDLGCGSGLFSLAARRQGARVYSFDIDPASVACAAELKRRFFPDDESWTIGPGSALDQDFLQALGRFQVVYSWGVLHHTGAMWRALENVAGLVAGGGRLFISIYNDQGSPSRRWRFIKRTYNRFPLLRLPLALGAFGVLYWRRLLKDLLLLRPLHTFRSYRKRGMSLWRDLIDWVGGYPFEVAAPGELLDFYRARGFELTRLVTTNSIGCNEFVFLKRADGEPG